MFARPNRIYTHSYPSCAALELNDFPRIEKSAKLEILDIIVVVVYINYSYQHDVTSFVKKTDILNPISQNIGLSMLPQTVSFLHVPQGEYRHRDVDTAPSAKFFTQGGYDGAPAPGWHPTGSGAPLFSG
jgi:hypothetical protein